MFPLGQPGGLSSSPYQVLSAFAGNPLLISAEKLHADGLIEGDLPSYHPISDSRVDFNAVRAFKEPLFERAFDGFENAPDLKAPFSAFCKRHKSWLDDYALFCALKKHHNGAAWDTWETPLRRRDAAALREARQTFHFQIRYHQFLQFVFFEQWADLKAACVKHGVKLMGDMPIFVAHDSADVWSNPDLFYLDAAGQSTVVAGCPPDYFSATGQRWGNPLYRWDVLKKGGYAWWVKRFRLVFELFDAARLDHFIGFNQYWRIPADHPTAEKGEWVPGPGLHFFRTVFKKLGRLNLVAEDLGSVTDEVIALREKLELPGMRVLQFAFGDANPKNPFLPHNYASRTVVYTGTHDNDTTVGWFASLPESERNFVLRYLNSDGGEIHWQMIRLAFSSTADTAIIPAQDLLGLGADARMNTPGTDENNWEWRLAPDALTPALSGRLKELTAFYAR
jgi:4-alpha-glucanotransferase